MEVGYDVTCREEMADRRLLSGVGNQSAGSRAPGTELDGEFGADRAAEGRIQNIDRAPAPVGQDRGNSIPFHPDVSYSRGSNGDSCRAKVPPHGWAYEPFVIGGKK